RGDRCCTLRHRSGRRRAHRAVRTSRLPPPLRFFESPGPGNQTRPSPRGRGAMKPSVKRRVGGAALLSVVVVAGFAAAAIGTGSAPAANSRAGATATGVMRVRVNLTRFQVDQKHHRLVAHGNVVTSYLSAGKVRATSTKAVAMRVQQGATCRVLHLELGELHLELLGLIVNLTPVDDPSIMLDI